MQRTFFSLVAAALMLTPFGSAMAQGKPDSKPPVPSEGLAADLSEMWTRTAQILIDMAEDFPESKYDFKSTPEVRSFAEQVLHATQANVFFVGYAQGKTARPEPLTREKYKTKAQIVEVLKKSVSDGAQAIKAKGDAGLMAQIKSPFAPKMIMTAAYWMIPIGHMAEHYGQLVQYYRLNKLVPPESRPKKKSS